MKAIVNPPGMKRCARCKLTKPTREFHASRQRLDGLYPYCKACRREANEARRAETRAYNRAYYEATREKQLAAQRAWRKANLAEARRRAAAGYAKNRAVRLAQQREYRRRIPEELRERRKAYEARLDSDQRRARQAYRSAFNRAAYAADPERYREYQRQRRARQRAATLVEPTSELLAAKWEFWAGRCWLCGGDAVEFDHVKPLAKGGAHMLCNLRPACRACNAQKNARWPLV